MSDNLQLICPHCDAVSLVPADQLAHQPVCAQCKQPLFTGLPLELTAKNFDQHVNNSDLPVLVDFWAPWCGPCRMMTPIIAVAAKTLEPTLRVTKLNVDAEKEVAMRFGIRSIPTLVIFHRGRAVEQHGGALNLVSLLDWTNLTVRAIER